MIEWLPVRYDDEHLKVGRTAEEEVYIWSLILRYFAVITLYMRTWRSKEKRKSVGTSPSYKRSSHKRYATMRLGRIIVKKGELVKWRLGQLLVSHCFDTYKNREMSVMLGDMALQ